MLIGRGLKSRKERFAKIDFVLNDDQTGFRSKVPESPWKQLSGIVPVQTTTARSSLDNLDPRGLTPPAMRDALALDRQHPVAAVHFHISSQDPDFDLLALHRRSSLLWWLPRIQLGNPSIEDRDLTVTTDPRLPTQYECSGPWTGLYAIKILTQVAFAEAVITLGLRDLYHPKGLGILWHSMYRFFMDHDAEISSRIKPEFGELWAHYMDRRPDSYPSDAVIHVTQKLRAEGRLPGYYEWEPED
ncbi:hypothetical protein BJX70DRAFT_399852 [Aspergillus crustosus]